MDQDIVSSQLLKLTEVCASTNQQVVDLAKQLDDHVIPFLKKNAERIGKLEDVQLIANTKADQRSKVYAVLSGVVAFAGGLFSDWFLFKKLGI